MTVEREQQISKLQREWIPMLGKGMIFSLIPILNFYLVEWYEHNPWKEVRAEAQLFNILLLELLAWALFFFLGKAKIALRIESIAVMVFGLVNHYVMQFRSTPFVPWDILSVNTAASVAKNYDYTPSVRVIVVSVLFLLLIVGVRFLHMECKWKSYLRLIPGVIVLLVLCLFVNALQNDDFKNRHYLYPFLFTPVYMTQVNGMLVTFAMNLEYIAVDKPAGYSAADAQEVLESYQSTDAKGTEGAGADKESDTGNKDVDELPNVIVVMDEAFSDLAVLGDFTTNEDYMPFVHSLEQGADNTITGYLNVSVCGGNTANTEFEFLTGNTMAFLPAGSIPYQQYIKDETPSLASYLANLGYETYGMHPYNANGWNRDKVYPLLGFDQTLFLGDFTQTDYVRKYVSDSSDSNNIIRLYGAKENQPMFTFNVTMQNHGGYTDTYQNFVPDIKVEGMENLALEQYLSLVKKTDEAFSDLVSYFSKQKEKTVLVFFGDHQPSNSVVEPILNQNGMNSNNLTSEQQALRYQVPYVIWANYDIEEGTNQDISANYLGAKVCEAAGIPTTSYQNYLLELQKEYPIISAVRVQKENGSKGDTTETNVEEAAEGLLQYKQLQYYQLFDWKEEEK